MRVEAEWIPEPGGAGVHLDHVGWFMREDDPCPEAVLALGLELSPEALHWTEGPDGRQPSGTANRCAMLAQGYLEFISTVPGSETVLARAHRLAVTRYEGVHLVAFRVADARAAHARLSAEGFQPEPPVRLRREAVQVDGGRKEARFSVVRVPPSAMPEGRVQLLVHETPAATWGEWPSAGNNGRFCLSSVLVSTSDPEGTALRWARFTGGRLVTDGADARVLLDRGWVAFATPTACAQALGRSEPFPELGFAAVGLSTTDIGWVDEILAGAANTSRFQGSRQVCLGSGAGGTSWILHEPGQDWVRARVAGPSLRSR